LSHFTPSVSVEEEYNDNIFLAPDGPLKVDDWITRTRIGLNAELLGRTRGLELTYNPWYEWYNDYDELNGWNHDALARIWNDFTPNTRLELTNSYLETRDPLGRGISTDPADPLVPPTIDTDQSRRGRPKYRRNATTIRLDHQFGAEDTVYAGYEYSILRGLESPNFEDDNDIWQPSVGGTYWFTNLWGIESDLYYSNRDYDVADDREEWGGRLRLNRRIDRHLNIYAQYNHTIVDYTEGLSSDYDVYLPSVGFNYQLDQNTRIDIAPGWYFVNYDSPLLDNDDSFIINATADKVWPFRQGLFGITLLSGYYIDDAGTEDLGLDVYYEARARTEFSFTPRFSATATLGYRYDDYPNAAVGETEDRQTLTGTAGLEYQALRWLFLNLDYSYRDRSSTFDINEYTENRVIFSITLTPDQAFKTNW
jgi:hypothetical protein